VCCLLCVQTEVIKTEFERLQARLPMDMLSMKRCVSELCISLFPILYTTEVNNLVVLLFPLTHCFEIACYFLSMSFC